MPGYRFGHRRNELFRHLQVSVIDLIKVQLDIIVVHQKTAILIVLEAVFLAVAGKVFRKASVSRLEASLTLFVVGEGGVVLETQLVVKAASLGDPKADVVKARGLHGWEVRHRRHISVLGLFRLVLMAGAMVRRSFHFSSICLFNYLIGFI